MSGDGSPEASGRTREGSEGSTGEGGGSGPEAGERRENGLRPPTGLPAEDLRKIQLVILLLLGAGAAYLIWLLLEPFLPALVTSAVVAALVHPAYRRFEEWLGMRDVAAFIGTTVIFFLVLVPVVGFSFLLIDQLLLGIDWLGQAATDFFAPEGAFQRWVEALSGYAGDLGIDPQSLSRQMSNQMQEAASILAGRTLTFLSGLGGWLLQAGVALFTLFYLLRDADALMAGVKWLVPLESEMTEHLVARARDVIYATIYGNVVVGVVQGILGGLAFWALGLPAAALWGTVMGLTALLPAVGPPMIWGPAAIVLLFTGRVVEGLVLLAYGAVVVGSVDNVVRVVVVGGRAQLHSLVVFFSVLGGLFMFGTVGFFAGPVLFVVGLSVIEMARLALEPGRRAATGEEGMLLDRMTGVRTTEATAARGEGPGGAEAAPEKPEEEEPPPERGRSQ